MALTQIRRAGISANARDRVSVLDYIPVAQHAAIRAGTSTYDAGQNIQSALTDTSTSPNSARAVFFPAGKYNCSISLSLETGAKLIGEALEKSEAFVHKGTGTVIQFTGTANGITAVQKNKIEFYNINLRSSDSFSGQYIVKFDATYACRFHNVVIVNNGTHSTAGALFMDDDDDNAGTADYAWSNFFDNCLFSTGRSKGHTFQFYGSDSWFNNIYSSGGKGIKTTSAGNNWSNIHSEHSYSNGTSASATGTNAGFTVCEIGYSNGHEGLINVTNLYVDLNDIALKWDTDGTGSVITQYNFTNILCRSNGNCDFLFENSGSSTPNASGGSILNYQSKGTPSQAIKTSGTVAKPLIQTEGSSLTDIKIGIDTGSPNVKLDVGGSSTTGLSGLTNPTFYTGFQSSTSFGGVVMGAGPNGNTPFVAASKLSNGTALALNFYTNGTKRLSIDESSGHINVEDGNIEFASGHGLDFSANPNASGVASNLFHDYEEGSFTPTVSSGVSAIGYSTQAGRYTKIGDTVHFTFTIRISSATLTSSAIKFDGLPFTAVNDADKAGGAYILASSGNFGTTNTFRVTGNNTQILVISAAGDLVAGTATSFNTSNRMITLIGCYHVTD